MSRLALINMPFAGADRPSLGLGLLAGLARRQGWEVDSHYFNLEFGALIGAPAYRALCGEAALEGRWFASELLVGEFLFAQRAAGQRAAFRAQLLPGLDAKAAAKLDQVGAVVPGFIERCAEVIAASAVRFIGFTSTFEQTQACVALARAIRKRCPHVLIGIGGANCEAGMGRALARLYDCFDLVCTGEADLAFPGFLKAVADGSDWWNTPGFVTRREGFLQVNPPAPLTRELDDLPEPEYGDYFATLERLRQAYPDTARTLMLETSRGCWWGERSHCSFCGLNASTLRYRAKSPERALEELRSAVTRHDAAAVEYTDNILNFRGLDRFLPGLRRLREERQDSPRVFFETKSNLSRAQLRELAASGIDSIQPGIESFDDEVLRRMGKGVRGLQNLALLKWARLYGVRPAWNLLFGFPAEPRSAYRWMARLIPRILHLDPPSGCASIRLDRFSPHFNRAASFGLTAVRPAPAYAHVFDAPEEELAELAYYFECDYADGRRPIDYARPLVRAVARWRELRSERVASLHALWAGSHGIEIWDTRGEPPAVHRLEGLEAGLYTVFDAPRKPRAVAAEFGLDLAQLERWLRRWRRRGLIAEHGGYALSLATIDDATLARIRATLTTAPSNDHTLQAYSMQEGAVS